MKKWIVLLLITALLLGCSACGSVEEGLDQVMDAVGEQVNQEITRGTVDGNVYSSAFSGLTFTKPDDWIYASDAEIAQMMDVSEDSLNDMTAYQEAMVKVTSVYDMMVSDLNTGNNVCVMYENLAVTGNDGMTEEEYIALLGEQLQNSEGVQYTMGQTSKVTLSNMEYHRVTAQADYGEMQIQQNYYARAMDRYMSLIIITTVNGVDVQTIEAMFSN